MIIHNTWFNVCLFVFSYRKSSIKPLKRPRKKSNLNEKKNEKKQDRAIKEDA